MSRKILAVFLFSVLLVVTGCANTPQQVDPLKAADIYLKSMEAMEKVNAIGFTIDMTQKMAFPGLTDTDDATEESSMEMQMTSSGRMTQNPLLWNW